MYVQVSPLSDSVNFTVNTTPRPRDKETQQILRGLDEPNNAGDTTGCCRVHAAASQCVQWVGVRALLSPRFLQSVVWGQVARAHSDQTARFKPCQGRYLRLPEKTPFFQFRFQSPTPH